MKFEDIADISYYLKEIYNSDIIIDETALLKGKLEGFINGKAIKITYDKNNYLMLSTENESDELIEELIHKLSVVMKNNAPICKYRLFTQFMAFSSEAKPTVEWDIIDPEGRIKAIVNGNAYPSLNRCLDIEVYENGKFTKNIESYIEEQKEVKKFGTYMGSLRDFNPSMFNNPIQVFLIIEFIKSRIAIKEIAAHNTGMFAETNEDDYALDYCIYITKKFGVEVPVPLANRRMEQTDSYLKWYNFYHDHFRSLSPQKWTKFKLILSQNGDLTEYLPTSSWQDSTKTFKKTNLN